LGHEGDQEREQRRVIPLSTKECGLPPVLKEDRLRVRFETGIVCQPRPVVGLGAPTLQDGGRVVGSQSR